MSSPDDISPADIPPAEIAPAEIAPADIAAWIDAHDPVPEPTPVAEVLETQRADHDTEDGPEVSDEGVATLVNNTGHDGGAATG